MIFTIFLLFGLMQHVLTISCYTCDGSGNFCPVPFNIDGGEENNENDINSYHYGSTYFCQSDHYIDLQTGQEKLIINGVKQCEDIDIPNHRRHCCNTDNCNKVLLPMERTFFIPSNEQRSLPSIICILLTIIFQYIY